MCPKALKKLMKPMMNTIRLTSVAQVRVANLAISVSGDQLTLTLDEPQPITIYDLSGRSIATSEATTSFSYTLPKGTYIVRCGDKVTRVVM